MAATLPRVCVGGARLGVGAAPVPLPPATSAHLATVLRLRPGDTVRAFADAGDEGEWLCTLVGGGGGRASSPLALRPVRQLRPPPPPPGVHLHLLYAPIRPARMQGLVERATELGASALWPLATERCQHVATAAPGVGEGARRAGSRGGPMPSPVALPTPLAALNAARGHALVPSTPPDKAAAWAVDASEQSERLSVPALLPPLTLREALAGWSWGGGGHTWHAPGADVETGAPAPLPSGLRDALGAVAGDVWGGGALGGRAPPLRALLVCDEAGSHAREGELSAGERLPTLREAVGRWAPAARAAAGAGGERASLALGLAVGPEGGWSDKERALLRAMARAQPTATNGAAALPQLLVARVGIGSWAGVLRTETAAAAALVAAHEALEAREWVQREQC